MATIDPEITEIKTFGDDGHIIFWEAVGQNDDGDPVEMIGSSDRSVQVTGTFGSGGTIVLEGSNDGTNYETLTDPQGNDVSFQAAGLVQVIELTRYVRPRVTAGDGTTDLDVHFLLKRTR